MVASLAIGIGACAIVSLFFGSVFVPVKCFNPGDGVFVQWIMGCAIFLVGLVVDAVRNFPEFQPLAMLGGALWASGNVMAIPIINEIGLALSLLLWAFPALLSGWGSGRFGLFGLKKEVPNSEILNGCGLTLALISTIMFALVKSEPKRRLEVVDGAESLLEEEERIPSPPNNGKRRWIAIGAAMISGLFYGLCFVPVIWLQNNRDGASQNGLDYVFSHYTGILAATTSFLVLYAVLKRNQPFVNPATVLPSLAAGTLWGIGQSAFFVANDALSEAVTFPIIGTAPGIVSALWGVLYFREIRGRKNLTILCGAICVTLLGVLLSGFSRA